MYSVVPLLQTVATVIDAPALKHALAYASGYLAGTENDSVHPAWNIRTEYPGAPGKERHVLSISIVANSCDSY
jgi:hypothetical protein